MDYEGLIDGNRVLIASIACSMNYETAVTFTYGHFNKVVFAVYIRLPIKTLTLKVMSVDLVSKIVITD